MSHRVERIQALDALIELFPSEGKPGGARARQTCARLQAGTAKTSFQAPAASVELRRRLFAATREVPGCEDTNFLSVFLGGGEPRYRPSKADEDHLRELCSAGTVFEAALVEMLPELSRLDEEGRGAGRFGPNRLDGGVAGRPFGAIHLWTALLLPRGVPGTARRKALPSTALRANRLRRPTTQSNDGYWE